MGKILLFYKYVDLEYPKQVQKWLQKLCADLRLTGRIIIAHEGINATVGGSEKNTEIFKTAMAKIHALRASILKKAKAANNASRACASS